jgi:hypothetical protein
MFFGSGFFWILMGVILVLIGFAFKEFADERGWIITWWKALLGLLWYGMFCMSFYTYGTLVGENEASAGLRLGALLLFISIVLGIGLWRLMAYAPKTAEQSEG